MAYLPNGHTGRIVAIDECLTKETQHSVIKSTVELLQPTFISNNDIVQYHVYLIIVVTQALHDLNRIIVTIVSYYVS